MSQTDPIIVWIIDVTQNEAVASWRAAQVPEVGDKIKVVKHGENCAGPMDQCGVVVERLWKTTTNYPKSQGWDTRTECYVNVRFDK